MTDDTRSALAVLGTATLSDALDKIGVLGSALGIAPLDPSSRMVGRAFTVRYVPVGHGTSHSGDWLDDVALGQVPVIDNGGRVDCTVWGDIMTSIAAAKQLPGTVIDGVCRDSATALDIGYPIFSRGRFMRTGKDRIELAETGGTVNVGGVRVRHGDWVVGDADGLVVIAAEAVDDVVAIAREIAEREASLLRFALLEHHSLRAAREKFQYHTLQRPSS